MVIPIWFLSVLLGGEGNGTPLQYSCLENPMDGGAWQAAVHGVAKSRTRLSDFTFTFHFHALEKEMATYFSVHAWRIPGTGEPGGLPSMGSHRVGHDWRDSSSSSIVRKFMAMLKCDPQEPRRQLVQTIYCFCFFLISINLQIKNDTASVFEICSSRFPLLFVPSFSTNVYYHSNFMVKILEFLVFCLILSTDIGFLNIIRWII